MSIQKQASSRVEVGEHTYGCAVNIRTWKGGDAPENSKLKIGKYCSLADNINIFLGGNHRVDWISTYPFATFGWPHTIPMRSQLPTTKGDIIIGNDVWIASHATILSGVKIGHGAVIGTLAVVASDVEPYGIAVGNPARVVKKRFSDEDIKRLLEIAWWDWPLIYIQECAGVLSSGDLKTLFAYYNIKKK